MAYITPGETFDSSTLGKLVTASRLNGHVANAVIGPGFITSQTAETAPVASDYLLFYDASNGAFRKVLLSDFFASQSVDSAVSVPSLRSLGNTGNKAAPGATTPGLGTDNAFTGTTNTFKHVKGTTGATVSALSALIVGTVMLDAAGNDMAGTLSFSVASATADTDVCRLNFGTAYSVAPHVTLTPVGYPALQQQGSNKSWFITSVGTAGFVIHSGIGVPSTGTMIYNYMVVQ